MEGPRTWPSRKLKASAAPTTRRSASAYDVPFVPTLRQNIKRFATAGRQGQAAKEGSAAVDRTFHTNYQPVRQQMQESKSKMEKAARTQALIDFSHLPKSDLLRLAAPQRKVLGHGKTAPANAHRGGNVSFVKSAAQASAARRGRQLGVVKHKKNPSVPVSLPRLENRFYQVSISVDDDKVYATPIPPKPPPPPPPSKKTSRTSDQSPASSPGTSRRPGQLSALRPRGKSAIFGGPRGAQERKKKRKRALSGRERRQQRSTAAIEIQRVARGRAARLRVNTMKELRVYAQSLTRKAQVRSCCDICSTNYFLRACVNVILSCRSPFC